MITRRSGRDFVFTVLIVLLGIMTQPSEGAAQGSSSLSEKISECMGHYVYVRFDEGIALANDLLRRDDLTTQDSVAIYEALSVLNYAKGDVYRRKSIDYLNKMSQIGPCVVQLPRDMWPEELRMKWYEITNGTDAFTCSSQSKAGVKSIAIMEFDNHSVAKYVEELGSINKGLAEMFNIGFRKISSLTVADRNKINYVLDEKKLQRSGDVDRATAVKTGKTLGVHYMIFGSFMQMDKKNTAMMVKVVSVETSEIIATADVQGKPDYWKLCQELVIQVAEKLDITLGNDVKKLIKEGGTESMDATTLYSKGLEYNDQYNYRKAYEYFKKAYELDSDFAEAKQKMDLLAPLAT